jgi:glycosyltransferase involved in cell wall biosynthesis
MTHGILYIANSASIGGGNRVLMDIIEQLDRTRFRPMLVAPGTGQLTAWAGKNGIPWWRIPGADHTGRMTFTMRVGALTALMLTTRTDLVHAAAPLCYRAAGFAARLVGARRVCHLGCPPAPGELASAFRVAPDVVVGCYQAQAREVAEEVGRTAPACRVLAIPNGVHTRRFTPRESSPQLPSKELRFGARHMVLVTGNLSEVKGHPTFLEAARLIAASLDDCAFVLVGGETSSPGYGDYLRGLASDLGIADKVHFIGWRDDVPAILKMADVVVLPSLAEGFPLAILEAMACARPVVATTVGGVAEAVIDGVTGLLVAPKDPGGLAAAIRRVLENPDLARRMGEAGRRRIEEKFSLEQVGARIEEIYGALLEEAPGSPTTEAVSQSCRDNRA